MRLLVQASATTIEYSDLQLTENKKKATLPLHTGRGIQIYYGLCYWLKLCMAHLSSWKLFVQFTPISIVCWAIQECMSLECMQEAQITARL